MSNCKYCQSQVAEEGDFCPNCGFIKFSDQETVSSRILKQLKYIIINPVAFIHSSRLVDPIFSGMMAVIIALVQIITIGGMGKRLGINFPIGYGILVTFAIIAIEAGFLFILSMVIGKKNIKFISFLNLVLAAQVISYFINIVGAILGVVLGVYIFLACALFSSIISLLLMYQGIKEFLENNIKSSILILLGSFLGTGFVVIFIIDILIKQAISSIIF